VEKPSHEKPEIKLMNIEATKPNLRRIRTLPFRMSFPCLPPMPPRVDPDSGRKTYGVVMLFPPGTDMNPVLTALKEAMIAKFGEKKNWPKIKRGADEVIRNFAEYNANAKTPLPGDWTGWIMVSANAVASDSMKPPAVVGPIKGPDGQFPRITDLREIYGGRWARATIEAYYFNVKGKNSGVTFGLSNVQLLKPDERFGADRPAPERDFDDVEGEMAGAGDAFEKGEEDEDDGKW
jgi:Protein of unknown function (DUF2815)